MYFSEQLLDLAIEVKCLKQRQVAKLSRQSLMVNSILHRSNDAESMITATRPHEAVARE
jgi:hypothetical protein